jgi:hypothetical protein
VEPFLLDAEYLQFVGPFFWNFRCPTVRPGPGEFLPGLRRGCLAGLRHHLRGQALRRRGARCLGTVKALLQGGKIREELGKPWDIETYE